MSDPITLRPDGHGRWWALNRREQGWASYGYPHAFLGDALERFRVEVVAWGRDEHGLYLTATERETGTAAGFMADCSRKIALGVPPRPANALNVEIGTPLARCRLKTPSHWGDVDPGAGRWLASGGSPLVLGACGSCPLRVPS